MSTVDERRIGSTDIACVAALYEPQLAVDLPKHKTAADVWFRLKTGVDAPKNPRMDRGTRLEASLLACYRQHVGPAWRPTLRDDEWWLVTHPRHEWATCSPDAFDCSPPPHLVVEFKTQSVWARKQWGMPGTNNLATRYLYQLAWSMACCDVEQARLLVAFGTDAKDAHGHAEFIIEDTAVYWSDRDAELEARLLEYGQRFVNDFVLTGKPPPVKPAHHRRAMKTYLGVKSWTELEPKSA
jgi:hypothetical protein